MPHVVVVVGERAVTLLLLLRRDQSSKVKADPGHASATWHMQLSQPAGFHATHSHGDVETPTIVEELCSFVVIMSNTNIPL